MFYAACGIAIRDHTEASVLVVLGLSAKRSILRQHHEEMITRRINEFTGDLWISWEEGVAMFLHYLLDADWAVCAGNWMWVSSSAFEQVNQK